MIRPLIAAAMALALTTIPASAELRRVEMKTLGMD